MTDVEAIAAASTEDGALSDEERRLVAEVVRGEYGLLMNALTASWSVSMSRTSVFLGVLSAAGVALGFVAQGAGFGPTFFGFALVILPVTLFLGLATFVRQVQIAREVIVYIIGMNRIRHFLQEAVPASRPYFILSAHDDALSLYRNIGAGMSRRPPRSRLVFALVQTPGIIAVVCGVVAGVIGASAAVTLSVGQGWPWIAGAIVFVVVAGGLLLYWRSSMADLEASIRPMFPTPADELDDPF